MFEDHKYQAFLTLAETLSYTKTAQKLFMSQQAISRLISQLESELGVYLFTRTTRSVTVTDVGELYYDLVKSLFVKWETRTSEISKIIENEDATCLHLGQQSSMDVTPLIRVKDLVPQPPTGIILNITCSSPILLLNDFFSKLLYAIIILDSFIPENYSESKKKLSSYPLNLIVSSKNPYANDDATWRDFMAMPFVSDTLNGENMSEHLQRAKKNARMFGLEPSQIIQTSDRSAAISYVELGKGITISSNTAPLAGNQSLRIYPMGISESAYFLYRNDNAADPELKILLKCLLSEYGAL